MNHQDFERTLRSLVLSWEHVCLSVSATRSDLCIAVCMRCFGFVLGMSPDVSLAIKLMVLCFTIVFPVQTMHECELS